MFWEIFPGLLGKETFPSPPPPLPPNKEGKGARCNCFLSLRLSKMPQGVFSDIDQWTDDAEVAIFVCVVCLHGAKTPIVEDRHQEAF